MLSRVRRRALRLARNLEGRQKYARYLERQKCTASHTATVHRRDNEVRIAAGPASFRMTVLRGEWSPPPVNDFAAFGLATLSLTHGWKITLNMPVSESGAAALEKLGNVFRLWSIESLSMQRLEFPERISWDPGPRASGAIVCLSGGVDSTYAAIRATETGTLGSFLLIAGADYKDANQKGFLELQDRVSAIAAVFGRDLCVVETDIRQRGFHWEMLHGLNLASCLHIFSSTYEAGGFALDNTIYQDGLRHPWGNNAALPGLVRTAGFDVLGFGALTNRLEKIARIHAHDPELISLLSVCWKDVATGGNCGRCEKCTMTRLAFCALGISEAKLFQSTPPLEEAVRALPTPHNLTAATKQLVRICELVDAVPEGTLKAMLCAHEAEIRKTYFAFHPMR